MKLFLLGLIMGAGISELQATSKASPHDSLKYAVKQVALGIAGCAVGIATEELVYQYVPFNKSGLRLFARIVTQLGVLGALRFLNSLSLVTLIPASSHSFWSGYNLALAYNIFNKHPSIFDSWKLWNNKPLLDLITFGVCSNEVGRQIEYVL